MEFIENQNFSFVSESEKQIEDLRNTAEEEGYLEVIESQLSQLESELKKHKDNDLINNSEEIKELLKYEIVGRYYHQKGRITSTIADDEEIQRAFEILLDSNGKNEYETILKGNQNK